MPKITIKAKPKEKEKKKPIKADTSNKGAAGSEKIIAYVKTLKK